MLQTAVSKFRAHRARPGAPASVALHSIVHCADPAYYSELQAVCEACVAKGGVVLFECIVQRRLVMEAAGGLGVLVEPVCATKSAMAQAKALGAVPQAEALKTFRPGFFVADLPAEDVQLLRQRRRYGSADDFLGVSPVAPDPQGIDGMEFARRVGNAALRAACLVLPFPEINLLLMDTLQYASRPSFAALFALLRGDVITSKRLAYAQMLVQSTNRRVTEQVVDHATAARNGAAIDAVRAAQFQASHVHLLYGAWHSPALVRRLEDELGMCFAGVEWRTAMVLESGLSPGSRAGRWLAHACGFVGNGNDDVGVVPVNSRGAIVVPVRFLSLWLLIVSTYATYAGVDWSHALTHTVSQIASDNGMVDAESYTYNAGLYFTRHLAAYAAFKNWFDRTDDAR